MSAGERFTMTFLAGKITSIFFRLLLILSLLSIIAVSPIPTMEKPGRPLKMSTSTLTIYEFMPVKLALKIVIAIIPPPLLFMLTLIIFLVNLFN